MEKDMEKNPGESGPEKEGRHDEAEQGEETRLNKLQKRLGSKVFGMLNRLGEKEKSKDGADTEADKTKDPKGHESAAEEDAGAAEKTVMEKAEAGTEKSEAKTEKAEAETPAEKSDKKTRETEHGAGGKPDSAKGKEEKEKAGEEKPEDKKDKEEETGSAKSGTPSDKETPSDEKAEKTVREKKDKSGEKKKEKESAPAKGKEETKKPVKKKPPGKKEEPPAHEKAEKEPEKPKESLHELMSHKEEIEALLSSMEDAYREATLPDKTYHEVKSKNERELEEIERKMKVLMAEAPEKMRQEAARPGAEMPEKKEAPMVAGKPVVLERPARPPAIAELPAPPVKPEKPRTALMIEELQKRIEERLRDVIASASVEVTDKRIRKVDGRLDILESDIRELKRTADTVAGYDKQFTLMNTEVEKTKALVESAKEAKNITDDKIQRIAESFAEIRSIVYQREAAAKEQEVVFDKIKDAVSQVDTARILREFTTRDEQLRDVNTRLERLERSGKMLTDTMNKIKGLMTDVGSLENIMRASKLVGEKLERIQEIEERIKATSSRLDSVYVDMKKGLDEFNVYKVKQDKLDGMSGDIVKNVEELTRRLVDYATKEDIDMVKRLIEKVKEQAKAAAAPALPPEARLLQEEKEEIETLLATLEENLRNKEVSEKEYNNARSKNVLRLKEIEEKIRYYPTPTANPTATGGKQPEPAGEEEEKHSKAMLLAKLRESYENGVISRVAYEKSKKLLLKK